MSPISGSETDDEHGADSSGLRRATELLTGTAGRRGLGWGTLSVALEYPTAGLAEALRSGALAGDLEAAIAWLDRDGDRFVAPLATLRDAGREGANDAPDEVLTRLEIEYTRLFVGPGPVPVSPYGSVYRDRDPVSGRPTLAGPSTRAVEALYAHYDLRPSAQRRDMPDHVATELEFMYVLCRREHDAWATKDAAQGKELRRAQQAFVAEHLRPWLPDFCQRLAAAAREPLYAAIAGFLSAYLLVESGTAYAHSLQGVFAAPSGAGSARR